MNFNLLWDSLIQQRVTYFILKRNFQTNLGYWRQGISDKVGTTIYAQNIDTSFIVRPLENLDLDRI